MNPLHEKYGDRPVWVNWKLETRNNKQTKLPYQTNGKLASVSNPKTWTTYDNAAQKSSNIGIVLTGALLVVDLDHVLDAEGNVLAAYTSLQTFLDAADTFIEISQSHTGLHAFFALTEPLILLTHKHAPAEAYVDKRYIATTGVPFGVLKPIRTITAAHAVELLALVGLSQEKRQSTGGETTFEDNELLERMWSAKNGAVIQKLYNGDIAKYDGDESRADAALLLHLAFWSGRNAAQMERVWLASPLAKRAKTQERADYRTRSIESAIKNCKEVYTSPTSGIDFLFTTGAKGEKLYNKNTENVCRILRHHADFKGKIRFDQFKNRIEIQDGKEWRAFIDSDAIDIQTRISILFPFMRSIGKEMVFDAAVKVGKEMAIDSGADFIRGLKWDQKPRLDEWLSKTYGTPSDPYHVAVGANWLKGMVRRIVGPGSKFDYVLVLEGPQGIKKSMSLSVLGYINDKENWHVESTMSPDSKDFFMQFEGKAIIEFSEGETLSRTEVKKMKSIITTASDRYRPAYGRIAEDFPRRCVFAMSTNQEEYLKDETGNRRWLPVKVIAGEVDIEWLRSNRDQLFAEAYERVMVRKETTYEFPIEETIRQQEARRVSDPNADKIVDWYWSLMVSDEMRKDGITVEMVFKGALSGFGSMKKYEEMAIADVLKNTLKLTRVRRAIGGVQLWRWVNLNTVPEEVATEQMEF